MAFESLDVTLAQLDLSDTDALKEAIDACDSAIFTPILSVSKSAALLLREGQRAVFFSSNNVAIDQTSEVYQRLREAEQFILGSAPQAAILRPTMIYGYPGDGNISNLVKLARRFHVLPIPGKGRTLQQPVFYRDLASFAVKTILSDPPDPGVTTVAGPAPLSQAALFREILLAARTRAIIAPIPITLAIPVLRLVGRLFEAFPVKADQLARAHLDKVPAEGRRALMETDFQTGMERLIEALDGTSSHS